MQWRLAAVSGPKVDRPLHHVYGSFLLSELSGREAGGDEAEFPLLNCTVVREAQSQMMHRTLEELRAELTGAY